MYKLTPADSLIIKRLSAGVWSFPILFQFEG